MRLAQDSYKFIEQTALFDKRIGGYTPFRLWPRQKEFLDLLHTEKKLVFLKKRQCGGSTIVGLDSLCQCIVHDNFLVLVLSKTGEDAQEFLRRIAESYETLPDALKQASPIKGDITTTKIEFKNGSRIISLPARKGEGYTADRVIIDEAGKVNSSESKIELEDVIRRVGPTLERAGGQLVLVSTANGFNSYRDIYYQGLDPRSTWKSFFFSCWDDPTFTEENRKQIVLDEGEDYANENYPRTAEEAFLASGRCVFHVDSIKKLLEKTRQPDAVSIYVPRNGFVGYHRDTSGFFNMYKAPEPNRKYVLGADVAEGLDAIGRSLGDYSALYVLDHETAEVVGEMQCHLPVDAFSYEILNAARLYNNALVAIEKNNMGLACLTRVRDEYHNLYQMESVDPSTHIRTKKDGWVTSAKSKPTMIADCDEMLRKGLLPIPSEGLLREMLVFVRTKDGRCKAQAPNHDDRVMAYMIALQARKAHFHGKRVEEESRDPRDFRTNQLVEVVPRRQKIRGY